MKKLYTLMMMAMMALVFTSCDDEDIAYTLEGTWKGKMYISSEWESSYYNATYSEITFLKDPYAYSSGSGYWVDYYSNAPWDYIANHIDWRVDFGTIYVHFIEEDTRLEIRDYRLDHDCFYGTIWDNGNKVDFKLYNTSRPYYDNYRWGYDSWAYGNYRSRTRSADSDSTDVKSAAPRRFVNPDLKTE